MAEVILLGTGSAWSGPARENSYMLVRGATTNLLVDCAGSPAQRLAQIGVSPAAIDHIILTHNHPDHIYGFPIFMLNAWMAGRRELLNVYGLKETNESAKMLLRAVGTRNFPNFFQVKYHTVEPNSITAIASIGEFDVSAAPSIHFVPTIGVRVTDRATRKSFAYSSDTSPTHSTVELARGVNLLFHEATTWNTSSEGHSSALEAGAIATEADVPELILLHLPPDVDAEKWRAAAAESYRGKIVVAKDFDRFEF